jgi:hypothetical protein
MKLYKICIGTDVKQYEFEVSEVEFNKTFNCFKLKIKNNILSAFLNLTNEVDLQFSNLVITSFKPFSEGDIKKLTRYIGSHKKE